MDENWFNLEHLNEVAEAQSQERRANPLPCVAAFLRDFWTDNTEEEARLVWRHKAGLAARYVEDCLYCLEQVIDNPPADLSRFVREQGGVYLYHDDDSATFYSDAETLAWLKQVALDFRAILEEVQSEQSG